MWGVRWSSRKKKKVRVRQKKTIFTALMVKIYKRQAIIFIATWLGIITVWTALVLKKTIFAPRYTLDTLLYNPETVSTYNNPEIYEFLNQELLGKNIYKLKRWWKEPILSATKEIFPIVDNFKIALEGNWVWYVTVSYHEPTLVFLLPEQRRYAAYQNDLYSLWTGDWLWYTSPIIELPRYTDWLENIDGIFYQISEERLHETYQIITNTLWPKNIWEFIYLPWGQKIFLSYKEKRLYIHANKDVNLQLAKLIDLENYYEWFNNIGTIDLWSVDDSIVR